MQITNVPTPLLPDARAPRADGAGQPGAGAVRPQATRPEATATRPAPAPARPAVVASAGPSQDPTPPEGTDPKLWSILTSEERAFFARNGGQGPLTYARVMLGANSQAMSPAMRGLRLDIRG